MLVLGLSYKADIDDDRESPSYEIIELLEERGAIIAYCDPYFPKARAGRKHDIDLASVPLSAEEFARHDCLVLSTAHREFCRPCPLPRHAAGGGYPPRGAARMGAAGGGSVGSVSPSRMDSPSTPWPLLVAFLLALWLAVVFLGGGYRPVEWVLPAMIVAIAGLVTMGFAFYPRRPRQLSLAVLLIFAVYVLWVVVSAAWGGASSAKAGDGGAIGVFGYAQWTAALRACLYLLVLALGMTYFTHRAARHAFRYLLIGAGLILILLCAWRLSRSGSMPSLFADNRFVFPLANPNHTAALLLVLFFPLLWMACDPALRVPLRGAALATASGLVLLAILTQSRGAMWSLAIMLLVLFLVSPARIRTFAFLVVPLALVVWSFPDLNSYWRLGPRALLGTPAVHKVLGGMLIAGAVGMVLALLEGWIDVRPRAKVVVGSVLLVAVAVGCVYGYVWLGRAVGSPGDWVSTTWQRISAGQLAVLPGWKRLRRPGSSLCPRMDALTSGVAARADFLSAPWEGRGVGLFEVDAGGVAPCVRPRPSYTCWRRAGSGGLLFFGSIALALGGLSYPRVNAGWRRARSSWLRRRRPKTGRERGRPDSRGQCVQPIAGRPGREPHRPIGAMSPGTTAGRQP